MMTKAFLGLGSNMGHKEKNISQAIKLLGESPGILVQRVASLYKTEPYGYVEQDWFLNTVIEIETNLLPNELLQTIHQVEQDLGRQRVIHWGPRTIDIDILTYGEQQVKLSDLIIPHKEMANRAFVLIPLAELEPDLHIGGGKSVFQALNALQDSAENNCTQLGVHRYQGELGKEV